MHLDARNTIVPIRSSSSPQRPGRDPVRDLVVERRVLAQLCIDLGGEEAGADCIGLDVIAAQLVGRSFA